MEDILKSNLSETEKKFWYGVGVKIQRKVKGTVQVLYNIFTNSIVIKIFFERFNYFNFTDFSLFRNLRDETFVINEVLNSVSCNICEKLFKEEE